MNPSTLATGSGILLHEVEQELSRQVDAIRGEGEAPVQRARMSNLVIFCNHDEVADNLTKAVPEIVSVHPARVLLLVGDSGSDGADVTAELRVWCQKGLAGLKACSEQVTLRAQGVGIDRLPFAVRELLIGDLPTNLWWAAPQPPPLAGPLLFELGEQAQQVVYDSIGWPEPARGVAATATWLEHFEHAPGRWRVVSDLNWRRLKYWRRLLAQALDPNSEPGALESIHEVLVEHGPHAVVQAWLLVSWLASRLDWRVQAGRVQPGVEICWQVEAPYGMLRVRLRRQEQGPSEVRSLSIACNLNGKPGTLLLWSEGGHLLAVKTEDTEAAPRTVVLQDQPLADLVARQLSDRERDPVFRESMAVAQVFAQSVLS